MSILLLGQLRQTLTQLNAQNTTCYSGLDQQTLRQQLSSTIKTLHDLYPDHLSAGQRREFIATLLPLEQQFLQVTLTVPATVSHATWQAVHKSLQTVIQEALSLLS